MNCTDNTTYIPGERKITPTGTIEITENGTYDVAQYANADVNVSGGGGSSNIVVGSFTTRSDTGRQDITVPYTGEGYPIECVIVPHGQTAEWNIYQSYRGISIGYLYKQKFDTTPSYHETTNDKADLCLLYGTSGGYDGRRDANGGCYGNSSATLTFMDKNTLSLHVGSSGFLFLPSTDYDYFVMYKE